MRLRPVRALLLATGALAIAATLASGQTADANAGPHVRGAHVDEALLLDELLARSQTARDLMERLDRSDLLIYISFRWFSTQTLQGRIGFLAPDRHPRLLAIEIDCRRNRIDQLVSLAHELRHAVEIAGAPSVWDARSLAALYTSIGSMTGYGAGAETFETIEAAETGHRVRAELNSPAQAADANNIRH
jgi:hypothetical protein